VSGALDLYKRGFGLGVAFTEGRKHREPPISTTDSSVARAEIPIRGPFIARTTSDSVRSAMGPHRTDGAIPFPAKLV
jgi:hypothetical protein